MSTRRGWLAGLALGAGLMTASTCTTGSPAGPEVVVSRDIAYTGSSSLDVYAPNAAGRHPVIVTLHGCCGSRHDLSALAHELAVQGAVVFNASWGGVDRPGAYPLAYQDVACAVRFARQAAKAHGGDPRRVTLVAWSDGAMVAAAVANGGEAFAAAPCPQGTGPATPDAFVALGGFFGWPVAAAGTVNARYVNDRTVRYFGGRPEDVPEAWSAGNPYSHLGRNPRLVMHLVAAGDDPLLADSECFYEWAVAAGHDPTLTVVEGAAHMTLISPRIREGGLALREVMAVASATSRPGSRTERAGQSPPAAPVTGCDRSGEVQ